MRFSLLLVIGGPVLMAQQIGGGGPGMSLGAVLGLLATWIGVIYGYFALRRTLREDAEKNMTRIAQGCVHEAFTKRAATLMDRREQEIINAQNDERYRTLTNFTAVANEIRQLTGEIARAAAARGKQQ